MGTVRVFEDLLIWQLAAAQCEKIWLHIEAGCFDKDTPLSDQINRSSGSVMDNIAEGFDRFSRADFRHFLIIARGSNAEVRSQIYRAKSRRHILPGDAEILIQDAKTIGIKINNLIRHLDKSGYKEKPKPDISSVSESGIEYNVDQDFCYVLPKDYITTQ